MDKPKNKSELDLELFSSNNSPRAGAGAYKLQLLLPELELKLLGSDFFHRAGAGAGAPDFSSRARAIALDQNVQAKSRAAKFMFQINLETQLNCILLISLLLS